MKLAVFTGQVFWFDGKQYSTNEAFIKFVTSFSPYFDKIIFCDPVAPEEKTQAYVLDFSKAEVCPLPYFSLYSLWRKPIIFHRIYRLIRDNIHHWDLIWLHAPHPVSLIFAYLCRKTDKRFFLFVRQNLRVYVGYRNRGLKRILAVLVASVLENVFRRLSQRTLTFTVGKEIFETYQRNGNPVYETAVSLVSEKDIARAVPRPMPRDSDQIRLLSVGRLDPEKGIIYLIDAVDRLLADGHMDIILRLVGTGAEEPSLRQEVNKRGLAQHVTFLGHVKHDDHLLDLYRGSDIFILPSLTEGWPQTLFEAMGCGIPIVATKVGGIPDLVKDGENGLLVNPASSRDICKALHKLIRNPELADRLVVNGFATARKHTIDVKRQEMIGHIEQYLKRPMLAVDKSTGNSELNMVC
jgi:glycosyltransferase involved in cell wall biosynthesis